MQTSLGVALYVRVSSEEQVDGYSLEAQEAVLKEDAKRRNIPVVKVYQDAGVSGVREDRKGLNALLRDAKRGLFSEVLVWTVSRVSRKLAYLLKVLERLKDMGIAFRSLNEQFDLATPMGKFALTMMGAVAQMQRESWMESSRIGMKRRVQTGRWGGGMMLGYRMIEDAENIRGGGKLEVVPEEAAIVRAIFTMYCEGLGYKAIVNQLNQEKKTGKCGTPFNITVIQETLRNAIYVGQVHFGKEYFPGLHEPIISQDLWDTVQERLQTQAKPVQKSIQREYLLSGVLCCPACGSGMVPTHTKGKRKNGTFRINYYYACSRYHNKGKSVCRAHSVRADEAEKTVLEWLHQMLTNPFWIKKVAETIRQRYDSKVNPLETKQEEAQQRLAAIAKSQGELLKKYEDDYLEREAFLQQMQQLKTEKEIWQTRLEQAEVIVEGVSERSWSITEITIAFRSFKQILEQAGVEPKKQLIRMLITKVKVNETCKVAEIEWKLPMMDVGGDTVNVTLPLPIATSRYVY
jgi:site-specific DNA recombinase